jgi:hypothetical protein
MDAGSISEACWDPAALRSPQLSPIKSGDKTVRCTVLPDVLPPALPYKEGIDRNGAQRNEDYGARPVSGM